MKFVLPEEMEETFDFTESDTDDEVPGMGEKGREGKGREGKVVVFTTIP